MNHIICEANYKYQKSSKLENIELLYFFEKGW